MQAGGEGLAVVGRYARDEPAALARAGPERVASPREALDLQLRGLRELARDAARVEPVVWTADVHVRPVTPEGKAGERPLRGEQRSTRLHPVVADDQPRRILRRRRRSQIDAICTLWIDG